MSTLARQRSPKCATAKTSHTLQFQDEGQLGLEDLLVPGTLFARFDNRPKNEGNVSGVTETIPQIPTKVLSRRWLV